MSDDYAPASRIELNIDWQLRLEYKPNWSQEDENLVIFVTEHPQSSSGPFDWSLHW